MLTLSDLDLGKYTLCLGNKQVRVIVYDGQHYGGYRFILGSDYVINTPNVYQYFKIKSA